MDPSTIAEISRTWSNIAKETLASFDETPYFMAKGVPSGQLAASNIATSILNDVSGREGFQNLPKSGNGYELSRAMLAGTMLPAVTAALTQLGKV